MHIPILTCVFSPGEPESSREIHLMRFTTGTRHKSANIPVVQLEFEGEYNESFKTRIEIMGVYLVVLLAHGTRLVGYQTLYLVDWVKGHVVYVRAPPPTTFAPLCEILTSPVATMLQRKYILPSPDIDIG
jgi:hypothetical protein